MRSGRSSAHMPCAVQASESDEQIADADRVGAKRIVAAQLAERTCPSRSGARTVRRSASNDIIGSHCARRSGDPVDQQDGRPVARRAVAQAAAMKNDLALARLKRKPPRRAVSARRASAHGGRCRRSASAPPSPAISPKVSPSPHHAADTDDRSLRCAKSTSRIQRPLRPNPDSWRRAGRARRGSVTRVWSCEPSR
jgi:hypothetical protein